MLTFEDVEKEVRRLAENNPDFVYAPVGWPDEASPSSCLYNANERQEGCIFGQAFANLSDPVSIDDEGEPISVILSRKAIKTTPSQQSWARSVQERQDAGLPWLNCIVVADEFGERS